MDFFALRGPFGDARDRRARKLSRAHPPSAAAAPRGAGSFPGRRAGFASGFSVASVRSGGEVVGKIVKVGGLRSVWGWSGGEAAEARGSVRGGIFRVFGCRGGEEGRVTRVRGGIVRKRSAVGAEGGFFAHLVVGAAAAAILPSRLSRRAVHGATLGVSRRFFRDFPVENSHFYTSKIPFPVRTTRFGTPRRPRGCRNAKNSRNRRSRIPPHPGATSRRDAVERTRRDSSVSVGRAVATRSVAVGDGRVGCYAPVPGCNLLRRSSLGDDAVA